MPMCQQYIDISENTSWHFLENPKKSSLWDTIEIEAAELQPTVIDGLYHRFFSNFYWIFLV